METAAAATGAHLKCSIGDFAKGRSNMFFHSWLFFHCRAKNGRDDGGGEKMTEDKENGGDHTGRSSQESKV